MVVIEKIRCQYCDGLFEPLLQGLCPYCKKEYEIIARVYRGKAFMDGHINDYILDNCYKLIGEKIKKNPRFTKEEIDQWIKEIMDDEILL